MKTFLTILSILVLQFSATSQVLKTNIVEHFTNTNCSICASLNPGIRANLQAHSDVLSISFHPSSPYSACFFSMQNPVENDGRTNFYGIYGSTPKLMVNGQITSPSNLNTALNNVNGSTSNFEMHATQLFFNTDSVIVKLTIKRVAFDTLIQARLFTGVKEDSIMILTANGEQLHKNVFRKSLSPIEGQIINLPTTVNDSIVFSYSYKIDSSWDATHLQSIAIMQRTDSKEVLQSVESVNVTLIPTSLDIANEAGLIVVPNPSNGILFIKSDILFEEYTVLSLSGRMIQRGQVFSNQLNLDRLPDGMYFIQLTGKQVKQRFKFSIHK